MLSAIFLLVVSCVLATGKLVQQDGISILSTPFVQVSVDEQGQIISLAGDFLGTGHFNKNVLSAPFGLEAIASAWSNVSFSREIVPGITTSTSFSFEVRTLQAGQLVIEEQWTVSVDETSRAVHLSLAGKLLAEVGGLQALVYGLYSSNPSLQAFTTNGALQMMGHSPAACLGVDGTVQRAFMLGAGSALDILLDGAPEVVLRSAPAGSAFRSGLQVVALGAYPDHDRNMGTAWKAACWGHQKGDKALSPAAWALSLDLLPNDGDFPVSLLADTSASALSWPLEDTASYLTGIYASAAGCLQSYYSDQQGIAAPTVAHPDTGYSPDSNFFDPDNFLTLSALLYSGDRYLLQQVEEVLLRTASTMCGLGAAADAAYCEQDRQRMLTPRMRARAAARAAGRTAAHSRHGQLMHHFVSLAPTYESIAGSEQLGPNVFWTLTALRYLAYAPAKVAAFLPYLDLSLSYLLSFLDEPSAPEGVFMVMAPGPLWIDVLVREHYASDSGAMMVHLLREMRAFYLAVDSAGYASMIDELAACEQGLVKGMNALLWDSASGDHYITDLDPRTGVRRDFVDYDSNLLAVALGIANSSQAQAVLRRIDSNPIAHVRATWCSEIAYSGDREDCYIVGGSVCGDSVVTLARIGWADAWARKRASAADSDSIRSLLLAPLQEDLLRDVWLYERYDAQGQQIRTVFYFEYPSLVSVLLKEVIYGLRLSLGGVEVDPLQRTPFAYRLGGMEVSYAPQRVHLRISNEVRGSCLLHQLLPSTSYEVQQAGAKVTMVSDAQGSLQFAMQDGALQNQQGITVTAML